MKTIAEQLDAARRELAMRKKVFPGWVTAGRMSREKAQHETDCMAAIVETLDKVKMLREVSEEMRKDKCGTELQMPRSL